MPQVRPMLDDTELQQVQNIDVDGDQVLLRHSIPGLEGDFLQRLNRRASRIRLSGVLTGASARDDLKILRDKYRAGDPVSFVADISTATRSGEVLIQELNVRELAGKPERFEYGFLLREYQPPPPTPTPVTPEPPEPPDVPIDQRVGNLIIEVIVEGLSNYDFDRITVTVRGQRQDGADLSRTLTNRTADNIWEENNFPAGIYTVEAIAAEDGLSGSEPANVRPGETEQITITLRAGATIAHAFIVHFTFDRAFIEPCLMRVLKRVSNYAGSHGDEKLVIVGHTDEVGPSDYNRSLGDRRARTVYAALTYGAAPNAAVDEWDEIRRPRSAGETPSIHEGRGGWGIVEYQYILQNLGFYPGNVDGQAGPLTESAVRNFQQARGLSVDGIVGNDTWRALIQAYLNHYNLNMPATQFLPNCEGEILKWLSCGEHMPLPDTPRPCSQPAWRPNRRTELLFVNANALPCEVPRPVTFDLPPPDGIGGGWCIPGPGNPNKPCCFVTHDSNERGKWLIQPAEAGQLTVQGRLRFEDGTPAANVEYILISPDGKYLHKNASGGADDGEIICGNNKGSPNPTRNRTDSNGQFDHPDPTPVGVYTLEIRGPYVARSTGRPLEEARGNIVCRHLTPGDTFDVTVVDIAVVNVRPSIIAPDVVVVRKPHTTPTRRPVTLRVDNPFNGAGTFNRSSDRIRFFTAATGGTEITFNGTDNVFTAAQLTAGHTVFVEGVRHSDAVNDVELSLTLTVGGQPGFTDHETMTSLELTLDIGLSRPAAGAAPPVMSEADKINPGRFLQMQNNRNEAERALVIVHQVQPADFVGILELNPINNRLRLFEAPHERPAPAQPPIVPPRTIATATIGADGIPFWLEGAQFSNAARDCGVQLGLQGVEPDGDHFLATVILIEATATAAANSVALNFVRVGLWDNAFNPATGNLRNGINAADNFIDLDTRRLHFRLRDPSTAGEARIDWRTTFDDGSDDDAPPDPPFSQELTLTETGAGSGVFLSRGLMLVTDTTDRDEPANSGLPAGHTNSDGLPDDGNRGFGDSNHRKRMITVDDDHKLDNQVQGIYTRMAGINPFRVSLPVFQRTPEERRRIRVHLIDVRESVGGEGVLTLLHEVAVTSTIREIYALCGIYAEIDTVKIDPPPSCIGWPGPHPDPGAVAADPGVEGFTLPVNVLVASPSQQDLINAVRTLPTFDINDIYIIFVNRIYQPITVANPNLSTGSRGESFPDSWLPAGSSLRSFSFVGVMNNPTKYTEVHEMSHLTTNLRNSAGGHFDLAAGDLRDDRNLMRNGTRDGLGVLDTKRLWDTQFNNPALVPTLIPRQIETIRKSRFIRNF